MPSDSPFLAALAAAAEVFRLAAGPGLEQEFLDRAVEVSLGDLMIPVISPEDLVVTKILASRAKDIDDVRGILRERRNTLDCERVRTVLEMFEQALSRSDLLRQFDDLLHRPRQVAR